MATDYLRICLFFARSGRKAPKKTKKRGERFSSLSSSFSRGRVENTLKILKKELVRNSERSTSNWRLSAGLSPHGPVVNIPGGRPL